MHIELSIILTILFGTFSVFAYLGNILAKGVACLTELKKDVQYIKENQQEIIQDMVKMEDRFLQK